MTPLRPPMRARIAARLVTGPAGHLWGGVCDWLELLLRYAWARVRGRDVEWL